nr:MMPL family transporter [Jiangella sp. DSM 45060]
MRTSRAVASANIDISDQLADALPVYLAVVIGLSLLILLVGVLFGLAMDYQLFLVSGMREAYVHGEPARLAVARSLRAGRAVVTAAAIIMISVFGGVRVLAPGDGPADRVRPRLRRAGRRVRRAHDAGGRP